MYPTIVAIVAAVISLAVGLGIGYYFFQYRSKKAIDSAQLQVERILAEAETEAKAKLITARDEAIRLRDEVEQEAKARERELRQEDSRLQKRRTALDERIDQLDKRERVFNQRQSALDKRQNQLEKLEKERLAELERVANMSQEDARNLLIKNVEQEARQDMARAIREVEAEAKEEGDRRAREIVTLAIQRIASDQVAEVAVSTVPLPNDEMKGRVIGRQGRNIRALEKATGVDLVVDDTPDSVLLSCFDPVRREVARIALSKLILDGRIHPARIEKLVAKAKEDVDQVIREAGNRPPLRPGFPAFVRRS